MRQQSGVAPLSAGSLCLLPAVAFRLHLLAAHLFSFLSPDFFLFSHSETMEHVAQWDRQGADKNDIPFFSRLAAGASDFTSQCRDKRLLEEGLAIDG